MSWITRAVLTVVVCVYMLSFLLPVTDANTPRAMYGFQAFFWGLVSIVYLPMWLANPTLWFGCLRYGEGRWKSARNAGLLAVLLGVSEVWMWDGRPEIGYYLWMSSMVLLALAGTIQSFRLADNSAQ